MDTIAAEAEIEAELEAMIAGDEGAYTSEDSQGSKSHAEQSDSESDVDDEVSDEEDLLNEGREEDIEHDQQALMEHRELIGTLSRKFSTLSRLNHFNIGELPESFMPAEPLPPFPTMSNWNSEKDDEGDDFLNAINKINFSFSGVPELEGDESEQQQTFTLPIEERKGPIVGLHAEFGIKEHMVLQEVLTTEIAYETDLQMMIHHFVAPLLKMSRRQTITPVYKVNDITPHQVQSMTSNIEEIADFHKSFLKKLQMPQNMSGEGFCRVFSESVGEFQMYTQYVTNYPKSLKSVHALKRNRSFMEFVESKQQYGRGGLDFLNFLIAPVHRIPDYISLLTELLKEYEANTPCRVASWCGQLQATVDALMQIVSTFNSCSRRKQDGDVIRFQVWRLNAIRKNTECNLEIDTTTKSISFRKVSTAQKYAAVQSDELVLAPQQIVELKLSSKNSKKCALSYFGMNQSHQQSFKILFSSPAERTRFYRLFNIHISSAMERPKKKVRDLSICAGEYQPRPFRLSPSKRKMLPLKYLTNALKECPVLKEDEKFAPTHNSLHGSMLQHGSIFTEALVGAINALGFSVQVPTDLSSPVDGSIPTEVRQFEEFLAEAVHDAWAEWRLRHGWKFCPSYCPTKHTHPSLVPYSELPDNEKQQYREISAFALDFIVKRGWKVSKHGGGSS